MAHTKLLKRIYDPEKCFPRAKNNHIISEANLRRYTRGVRAIHLYYIYIVCVCVLAILSDPFGILNRI